MDQFYYLILFCFVSGACSENPENSLFIVITKNNIISPKKQLTITSREVTVEIYVYKIFPGDSHDDVTLDQLICYDSKSNHTIFSNLIFSYATKHSTSADIQYLYKITQELKLQRGSNVAWQWLCKLYAHWDGFNKVYECEVKVEMKDKNETSESTSKDEGEEKRESKPAEYKASGRNRTEQTAEPKSKETNDGIDRGVEATNTLKNVNDSSNQGDGQISTTVWVAFLVASLGIFVVCVVYVLVSGAVSIFCICIRHPTPTPVPELAEQTDDLTDEHIYEEIIERASDRNVVDKGFKNYPALPVPEKEVNIYNIPYDHTPWFKNIGRKKRQQTIKKTPSASQTCTTRVP